jgi:hypothetical protein
MEDKELLTLGKLWEIANAQLDNNPGAADRIVCIPNNKGGMGGTSVTNVKSAGGGIDWDARKFFMWPENKMIEAGQEPVKDWKQQAKAWAITQMPPKWDMQKATAEELQSFYSWMLMFIRDCYSVYPKTL